MAKKAFSLLEVTVSIFIMGLTIVALLNILTWSNIQYNISSTSWKERTCLTDARIWLRNQIVNNQEEKLTLKSLIDDVKCPSGFRYNELKYKKQGSDTYFVKISVYEDKNNNGKADSNETLSRLFCFRKRSA